MAQPQLDPSTVSQISLPIKPTVVGLYGIPGSGKSFIINQLKQQLGQQDFEYYEGSGMISKLVPGGLEAFQKMEEHEKAVWRGRAIDEIGKESSTSGRVAVVAGHIIFWRENEESGHLVWTERDQKTFTHILYLDVPAAVIATYRANDSIRARPPVSEDHIRRWQRVEGDQLKRICLDNGILFSTVAPHKVPALLRDFQRHTEEYNLSLAHLRLNEVLGAFVGQMKMDSLLVMDGDRTLTADDTGALFWKVVADAENLCRTDVAVFADPLKELFSSPAFGYSYAAFRQAALLYEQILEKDFDTYCDQVASAVMIHPEFMSMLKRAAEKRLGAVVVTCGVRLIWEKIIERAGLSGTVKIIGAGYFRDGLVITSEVKRVLVARLRDLHHMYVSAFGDSVLDLPMLKEANRAVIVVGEEHNRSRTMEKALLNAIENEGLRAYQTLLPKTASPRLDIVKLPQVDITEEDFIAWHCKRKVIHATDKNAAKLLKTAMRNAQISGPDLRRVHRRVGEYLATELLPELTGLDEYLIPHVQGHQDSGHRIRQERKILIVALMRGGEPMAFGVNDALPLAMFIHAKDPEDVKLHHLQGQQTVILVDSVVNNGNTVIEFVQHIRTLHLTIRILVIAGVVQADSLTRGALTQILSVDFNVGLIALRLSDNKYTGKGTTDTGNRLFNTTHLQ